MKKRILNLIRKFFLGFFVLLTGLFLENLPVLFVAFAKQLLNPIFYFIDRLNIPEEQKANYAIFLMKTINSIPTPLWVLGSFVFLTPMIISLLFRRKRILLLYFWLSTGFDLILIGLNFVLGMSGVLGFESAFLLYFFLVFVFSAVIIRSVGFLLSLVFINKLEQKRLTTEKYY